MTIYVRQLPETKFHVHERSGINIPKNIVPQVGDVIEGYSHDYKIVKVGLNKLNEKSIWCNITPRKTVNYNPHYITGGI